MKILKIIILSLIFFFWISQKIFADDECTNESIFNYVSVNENFSKTESGSLKDFITNKKINTTNIPSTWSKISDDNALDKIKKINEKFIKSQDKKFSLAIEYVLKKFEENQEGFKWKKRTGEILEEFKTWSWSDFFIKNYLEKKIKWKEINKNPKNIPTSVLQKSVYLDFLIFSCELWRYRNWKEFKRWSLISDVLSKTDSKDFEKKEILEKEKIVVAKAISKYQAFLNQREMYVALRWVIEKLEHLKWRFEDFARLIWFLPAKLVDFWYKWK